MFILLKPKCAKERSQFEDSVCNGLAWPLPHNETRRLNMRNNVGNIVVRAAKAAVVRVAIAQPNPQDIGVNRKFSRWEI